MKAGEKMNVLINLMIKIVLMVFLGWVLKKREVITDDLQDGITNLLMTAVLPLNIIGSSCQKMTGEALNGTLLTAIFSFGYYIVILAVMYLVSRHLSVNENRKKLIVTMTAFANTGFIGFPLTEELFGVTGLIYAVVYNVAYNMFFYTVGIYLLSEDGKMRIQDFFKKEVTLTSFLGIFLFLLNIPVPEVIVSTCQTVGSMTVPLSMIVIGCTLADMNVFSVLTNGYGYLVTILRLVILPLIAFGVLKTIGVSGAGAGVCILLTGLPSGTLNVIVAQQHDCEPEFAASVVVQSMIFMIVSLPMLVWVMHWL